MDTAIRTVGVVAPRLVPARSGTFVLLGNVVVLIGLVAALYTVQPRSMTFRVGEVAGETVVAPERVTYIDHLATAARIQQARVMVPPVVKENLEARVRARQAKVFLDRAAPILQGHLQPPQKLVALQQLHYAGSNATALAALASVTPHDFQIIRSHSLGLLSEALNWNFDANALTATEIALVGTLPPSVNAQQRSVIAEILSAFLAPTQVTDWSATLAKQATAEKHVIPVVNTVYRDQVVVRRGDLVTAPVMEKLTALGLSSGRTGWREVGAAVLFASTIIVMLFWYLHAFQKQIISNPRLLLLVDISVLVTVAGARIVTSGHALLPYFLPVAATSTFAAVLIAPEACIAVTLAMAVLAGWIVANSFELMSYYFLSGAAGILAIRQVRHLKQFITAGAYISVFALCTSVAFGLLDRSYTLSDLRDYVVAAGFNGFVSSTLALGGFAVLSDFFGVTTMLSLLELGQPGHPLMRRLMIKAPGTYNHSLIVATMVERAAEDVGANALVAKAGALYHDVGKSSNPYCFVENQLGIGNLHDQLRAEESAKIIKGHVAQGCVLARRHKLPRVIIDAISEHHGTTTIQYFLHKARQEAGEGHVDPSIFTYPGPKPQSKETALIMLADGCESAVRTVSDHSPEKIGDIVRSIFEDRAQQGQLDESPLTLRDLEDARQAFCSVLNGLYHPRIDYPEPLSLAAGSLQQTSVPGASQ